MFHLPPDTLKYLHCSFCKQYLSRFPIYSYPENGEIKCGRCPVLSDQNPVHNKIYEAVAANIFFPCRYFPHGCYETFLPSYMEEHEQACLHRRFFCPFIPLSSCNWEGPIYELFRHYHDEHGSLALSTPMIEIDLEVPFDVNYLLDYIGELFLINARLEEEKIVWVGLRFIGEVHRAQIHAYRLELQQADYNGIIVLPESRLDTDLNVCLNKETALKIPIEKIRAALGESRTVSLHFDISRARTSIDSSSLSDKYVFGYADEDMLQELKCPVCAEYMIPPISQCSSGHSFCTSCGEDLKECPDCGNKTTNIRNYTLENLTKHVNYHCRYRNSGCCFVSKSDYIRKHENGDCRFAPFKCPFCRYLSCLWIGRLEEVMGHVKQEHPDYVLVHRLLTWFYKDEESDEMDRDCFVIEHMRNAFRVLFKYEAGTFYWNIQLVGVRQEAANFMFELNFTDNSGSGQKFYIRRNCSPYIPESRPSGTCIIQHYGTLSSLMDGRDLTYSCRIIRKCDIPR